MAGFSLTHGHEACQDRQRSGPDVEKLYAGALDAAAVVRPVERYVGVLGKS